jgi:hypothetical protein
MPIPEWSDDQTFHIRAPLAIHFFKGTRTKPQAGTEMPLRPCAFALKTGREHE